MRDYINDDQFEQLNWHEQRQYRWCTECNQYYHELANHQCNTEHIVIKANISNLFKGVNNNGL